VTDTDIKIDEETGEPAPELIATHYLSGIDELIDHLRAADQLGLGVRVTSYLVADEETPRFELDLLTSSPLHQEDDAE
jgi:hypothetical protein